MEPPETVNGIIMGASGNVLYTIQSISLQCIHTYIRKPYMLFGTKGAGDLSGRVHQGRCIF